METLICTHRIPNFICKFTTYLETSNLKHWGKCGTSDCGGLGSSWGRSWKSHCAPAKHDICKAHYCPCQESQIHGGRLHGGLGPGSRKLAKKNQHGINISRDFWANTKLPVDARMMKLVQVCSHKSFSKNCQWLWYCRCWHYEGNVVSLDKGGKEYDMDFHMHSLRNDSHICS